MLLAVMKTLDRWTCINIKTTELHLKERNDGDDKTNIRSFSLGVTESHRNYMKASKLIHMMIRIMIINQITQSNSHRNAANSSGLSERQLELGRGPLRWAASNHTSFVIDPDKANSTSVPSSSNNTKLIKPSAVGLNKIAALDEAEVNGDDEYEDDVTVPAEGEEEENDDEDEEEDEGYYTANPVDSLSPPDGAENMFDDFEALGLNSFYGYDKTGNKIGETNEVKTKVASGPLKVASLRIQKSPSASKNGVHRVKEKSARKKKKRRRRRPPSGQRGKSKRKKKKKKPQTGDTNEQKDTRNQPLARQQPDRVSNGTTEVSRSVAATSEQEQQASPSSEPDGASQCAMISESSGACVDYRSVEWALVQARRMIAFRRPAGLNSLEPSESTVHAIGELTEWTSRLLAMRFGLSSDEVAESMGQIDVSQTSLWRLCPRLFRSPWARQCYTYPVDTSDTTRQGLYYQLDPNRVALDSGRYRSVTGQCNNPLVPNLGSSFMPFVRLNTPEYGDGVGSSRRPKSGLGELPPARLVSLILHSGPLDVPSNDLSAMFASWGQLINHDLALASGARVASGHVGSCCSADSRINQVSSRLGRVCMPIYIGQDDPVYGAYGMRCHDFKRSIAGLRPGCSLGPRTQLNLVTSFVDGSFVYGSTRSLGNSLRSNNAGRGQMAVWNYFGRMRVAAGPPVQRKPLLPPQLEQADDECLGRREGLYCFRSGDMRTNQQVPLVVLHTIHTRQHNRIAQALNQINPHWSSERIYQEARHIHIAQIQHILMREYLPLLLGDKTRIKFNLVEAPVGEYWDHYEASLNPGISQEFAAAAFRQGHSTVASEVYRVDVASRLPWRVNRLRDLFRQPWPLFEPGAVDEFLLGLTETASRELDPFVSLELSGHLLQEPNEPVGLDLIAINIQRGRDQGVAGYNSMRDWCGLGRIETIDELVLAVGNQSAQLMNKLYESIDDIDLYSGGLSEFPLETDGLLGPTFSCIVAHQFSLLRQGDRYWYESSGGPHAFTPSQLASIKETTLARIICANSDQIWTIQPLAMRLPHPIYNPTVSCQDLPDLDISLWVELAADRPQQADDAGEEDDEIE